MAYEINVNSKGEIEVQAEDGETMIISKYNFPAFKIWLNEQGQKSAESRGEEV